jgi:kinesin family protein C1
MTQMMTSLQSLLQQAEAQKQQQQLLHQQQLEQQMQELRNQAQLQQLQLQEQLASFQHRPRMKEKKQREKKPEKVFDPSAYTQQISELVARNQELLRAEGDLDLQHQLLADSLKGKLLFMQSQLDTLNGNISQESAKSIQFQIDIQKQEETKQGLQKQLQDTKETMTSELNETTARLSSEFGEMKADHASKIQLAESELKAARDLEERQTQTIADLKQLLIDQERDTESLNQQIRTCETVRKRLHNEIQELKGNVRVICRVRPLLGKETTDGARFLFTKNPQELLLEETNLKDVTGSTTSSQKYPFKFDRVFAPTTGQREVFEEIAHLVQSSLDGFNCCIFAYGQTGKHSLRSYRATLVPFFTPSEPTSI